MMFIPQPQSSNDAIQWMQLLQEQKRMNLQKGFNMIDQGRALGRQELITQGQDIVQGKTGLFNRLFGSQNTDREFQSPAAGLFSPRDVPQISQEDKMAIAVGAAGRQMGGWRPRGVQDTSTPESVEAIAPMQTPREASKTETAALMAREQQGRSAQAYNERLPDQSPLTGDANQQYDKSLEQARQAMALAPDNATKVKIYQNLRQSYKELDNYYGWRMTDTLDAKEFFGGAGGAAAKPKWLAITPDGRRSIPMTDAEVLKYREDPKFQGYEFRLAETSSPESRESKIAGEAARVSKGVSDTVKEFNKQFSLWPNEATVDAYNQKLAPYGHKLVKTGWNKYAAVPTTDTSNIAAVPTPTPAVANEKMFVDEAGQKWKIVNGKYVKVQ